MPNAQRIVAQAEVALTGKSEDRSTGKCSVGDRYEMKVQPPCDTSTSFRKPDKVNR
jgi:hypothetical protein